MKVKILYGITAYGIADEAGSIIDVDDSKCQILIDKGLVLQQSTQATTTTAAPIPPKKATKKK